jgi:hypothetical protein
VARNYEKRMSENVVPQNCDENTVDPTAESMSEATEQGKRESGECEEYVQSTSKYFGASYENTKGDIEAHGTHLVQFLQQKTENGIRSDTIPCPPLTTSPRLLKTRQRRMPF